VSAAEQPDLFGGAGPTPVPGRAPVRRGLRGQVPAEQWAQWLADPAVRQRYRAKICWRGPDQCAYWLGAMTTPGGHGKLRVGARGEADSRRLVTAHVYGYQLHHGLLPDTGDDQVVAHRCDEPSCQLPAHWELISRGDNTRDWRARRHSGPLADVRGPAGRAAAIRDAILTAQTAGADVDAAITAAQAAGLPPSPPPPPTLF
jgi:hypothetical protein